MNKKYLLKGFAALLVGVVTASCSHDLDEVEEVKQNALDNAEATLGFHIPADQDWVMSSVAKANVLVNVDNGGTYTVKFYANNPLSDALVYVLAKGDVQNGGTYVGEFRYPSNLTEIYLGLTDDKGETMYKKAQIENGQINTAFETIAEARQTRAVTIHGDTYEAFNFPTQEELNAAFPTTIPSGALEVADLTGDLFFVYSENTTGRNYQITKTGEVTVGGSWDNDKDKAKANNVYVKVDGSVTIKRNGSEYINLYILKGNVTLDSNFGQCGGLISVAAGATLNDSRRELAHNGGIKLFNRGTVNATNSEQYDINNKAAFYNEGTVNVTGAMKYSAGAGNTSFFINMGDGCRLNAPSMTLNSTCHFFTDGQVNITGETRVTQSEITWVNNGHYTTGSMVFSAKNGTFYNYCQLIVKNNCNFTDGLFNMMQNSYAEFGTGLFNNFRVNMANNSGFNVKNGSKWGRQGADFISDHEMQGFVATNDAAKVYVRLGGLTQVPAYKGYAFNVKGANLTLAYENMKFYKNYSEIGIYSTFDGVSYWDETTAEQLAANSDEDKTWNLHNVTKIITGENFKKAGFSIKTGQCAATWTYDPPQEMNNVWTYAFEDNKVYGDYDMNDVVLKVREDESDASKLIVTLVAAGCEYDNKVYLGSTLITWGGKSEVHEALGVDKRTIVNTGWASATPVSTVIAKPSNFDFQAADFKIVPTIKGEDAEAIDIAKNGAPYGIVVPVNWQYPTERTNICDAYDEDGHSFRSWSRSANHSVATDWYNNPTGNVMNVYNE